MGSWSPNQLLLELCSLPDSDSFRQHWSSFACRYMFNSLDEGRNNNSSERRKLNILLINQLYPTLHPRYRTVKDHRCFHFIFRFKLIFKGCMRYMDEPHVILTSKWDHLAFWYRRPFKVLCTIFYHNVAKTHNQVFCQLNKQHIVLTLWSENLMLEAPENW